jgi:putative transposase
MPFWKCYYHVIWATQNREPIITRSIEAILFDAIQAKSAELRSAILAVNGVDDHVHVAVNIPPSVAVSAWVGGVKGASSFAMNSGAGENAARFRWQESYGVLTFGARNLDMVLDYIARQKDHHANGTLERYLEQDEP